MRRINLKNEPNLKPKLQAFSYQNVAFNKIKDLSYSAVFHEQGLGKTKIAIDLLLYWLGNKDIDTVLIITKKQLVHNWQDEFSIHTKIRPAILSSNRNDNFYVFNGPARIIITNFEVIVSELDRFKLFLKARNVAVIIDESAKIKNPESKLTKSLFELSIMFKIRVIMTGTPVANRPYDIWSQIYFLDQGKSLGKDFKSFKKSADLSNDLSRNRYKKASFEDFISLIFKKIESFSVRETKSSGIISLPAKEYINIWTEFNPRQKQLYDSIKDQMIVEIKKGDKSIYDDSSESLKRLLRLVQVTSNPRLFDDDSTLVSSKEDELDKLLYKIIAKNEKCIVWSSFIENIEYFCEKYSKYEAVKVHGKMNIENRNSSIDKFKNGESKILFATPQAAKEGLTLTIANHVIFYDRGFSLDDYLQAQDRIHRISQKKKCYVYNIMIKNSIDEWIDLLLKAKKNAALLVQGDISKREYQKNADYSYGDMIKNILGMH
ncbi:DEAD/DEAH box helicase [Clostridium butyricum]|uniref:DEAD/DEAH box helicase n=1 Tax=Clostridium butyricum TaxID=1492 RepID=UPI00374F6848